jgi:proline racemase
MIRTLDYHTGGEPFRIVLEGGPELPGATVAERRVRAIEDPEAQRIRRLLCHEPRGHADMYGCFIVPPDDEGADLGVLFWHKDGFSTACGHGTIALGVWAAETGRAATRLTVDVPSGRVSARITGSGAAFRNVPSYVIARDLEVEGHRVDLAFGGAIYASVRAPRPVEPHNLPELRTLGRAIKWALNDHELARHPTDPRLSGVYGTILHEELGPLHQRNVTVFADGEVDRSPCGSGTSARLALLGVKPGETLVHESIVGSVFHGRVVEETPAGLVTEVEGSAYRTGEHSFVLDPGDPLGTGFVLP